jgi:hypothetical protein
MSGPHSLSVRAMTALRMLRDCGCVRVAYGSRGMIECWDRGYADTIPVDGHDDALDFRITKSGRIRAAKLPALKVSHVRYAAPP